MFVLGVLLLAAAAAFGIDEVVSNNPVGLPDPQVFGQSLGITSGRGLFLIGVATGAGVLLGLILLLAGMRRRAAKASTRRQERQALKQEGRQREELAEENETLRRRLAEREEPGHTTAGAQETDPATAEPEVVSRRQL